MHYAATDGPYEGPRLEMLHVNAIAHVERVEVDSVDLITRPRVWVGVGVEIEIGVEVGAGCAVVSSPCKDILVRLVAVPFRELKEV